ncbi:AAA family ATPase [Sinorhizobium medicae]|uniref:AAA family ATPase n=1 Tax=Sinorhizobium medicae TaxID=110321 RepID=UPI000C796C5D|nr:AAA family ATPase [Sinorhizobium medicae]PLU25724.1 hypothetical protein BMJ28_33470 [Sinorhizobium medicae]
MNRFTSLELNDWRQFTRVELDLSKNVTILTGQNGCGKTTILNILSNHFGWSLNLVSTPYLNKKRNERIWSDVHSFDAANADPGNNRARTVGRVGYNNDANSELVTNEIVGSQYQLQHTSMQSVIGLHIPSHRPVATYNHVPTIPTDPQTATQQYQTYQQLLLQFYGGNRGDNPGKIQKQSIISLAVFGEGNSTVQPNYEMKRILDTFQDVLKKVMPRSIGFRRLDIRMPEVVLMTDSGDFALDAMSGGINAIFGIAWQIHMFGHNQESFSVTIDEPENHLHPSIQRTLLPSLSQAFPNCSIIVATHSPFIVSSFEEANVYGLSRNEEGKIESHLLDLGDLSGTPNDILREILDVESNLPVWVEKRINLAIEQAAQLPLEQRAKRIMAELGELGIADSIVEFQKGRPDAQN